MSSVANTLFVFTSRVTLPLVLMKTVLVPDDWPPHTGASNDPSCDSSAAEGALHLDEGALHLDSEVAAGLGKLEISLSLSRM